MADMISTTNASVNSLYNNIFNRTGCDFSSATKSLYKGCYCTLPVYTGDHQSYLVQVDHTYLMVVNNGSQESYWLKVAFTVIDGNLKGHQGYVSAPYIQGGNQVMDTQYILRGFAKYARESHQLEDVDTPQLPMKETTTQTAYMVDTPALEIVDLKDVQAVVTVKAWAKDGNPTQKDVRLKSIYSLAEYNQKAQQQGAAAPAPEVY